jgi:chromosome segregation ATPase
MFGRESIHALLRQKDGEVKGLQSSLVAAEASNAALAEEVAEVTRQNDSLRAGANSAADADEKMEALQARHAAALEILGEKAEQLQAAQEDLDDLREWMRSHALNSVTTDG